jgi:hypothetical protein
LNARMRVPSPAASTMARFGALLIRVDSAIDGYCPQSIFLSVGLNCV